MYIVRSEKEKKASVVQMELSDFFGGPKRKIVFNADDSKEAKRAERILKPKGLRKARKKPQKVKPQRQQEIEDVLPKIAKKKKEPKPPPKIKSTQKRPVKGSIVEKTLNLTAKPKKERQSGQNRSELKEKTALPIAAPVKIPTQIIPETMITQFGNGGDLEVECPFCSDTIYFRYEDIDVKKNASTRICSCDAIARISIQQSNRGIFSDFKIQNFDIASQVRKYKNTILDEYNNEIITYAFLNRAE